jgi:hypothetical protein
MKRLPLMLGALGATLAATAYLALQPEAEAPAAAAAPAAARTRAPTAAQRSPSAGQTPLARPAPDDVRSLNWPLLSPVALAAWAPPTPPRRWQAPIASAATGEPVKPRPPAFPYRWIGMLLQDGQTTALLDSSQRSLGVQAGQVLDQRWRVERISAERMDLTWLPTGDAVTLDKR